MFRFHRKPTELSLPPRRAPFGGVSVALLMLAAACTGSGATQNEAAPPPSSSTTTAPPGAVTTSTSAPPALPQDAAACVRPITSHTQFDPAGGVHYAFIAAVDEPGRAVSFDMVQIHDDENEPNGFRLQNESRRLRQAGVDPAAELVIFSYEGSDIRYERTTFEQLSRHLSAGPKAEDGSFGYPFRLTFTDGTITGACQTYLP